MVLLPESLSSFFILYKSCQSGFRWLSPTDFRAGTGSMRPDLPPYGSKVSQTPIMGFAVGASKALLDKVHPKRRILTCQNPPISACRGSIPYPHF